MKYIFILILGIVMSGCSLFSGKRVAEVVPSCFSDGENQEKICKTQRVNEDNKVVTTRCIGMQNREANPVLRGKCVEKICAEGSNTDCVVKGEMRVLEQYAELVTSNMFSDGEGAAPAPAKKPHMKEKKSRMKKEKSVAVAPAPAPVAVQVSAPAPAAPAAEVDTDPSAALPPMPEKPVAEAPAPAPTKIFKEDPESSEPPQMSIALKPIKPAKKKANRSIASVKPINSGLDGFKKVCVAKNDAEAPQVLRGKCATRNCTGGKCSYQGRKEMFDYVARAGGEAG